ncbi:MAG: zinc ABC transporter ATP-binding protein [Candidatus Poseidoniales archaeon]|nr:metal ABC transporter ATP-binding protein [Candidatus Thermoplasmatota archaeon]GIQ97973.1 MAG: zinc ABC transporter ATP-binding protein [Candidatus Poseidoniales archaeon]
MTTNLMLVCGEEILQVSGLSVNRSGVEVISDINLSVNCGEFVGIVGPNGAGKTTLILTILGILKPRKGHVSLSKAISGKVGWVPQAATSLPKNMKITVREFIQLGTLDSATWFLPFGTKYDKQNVSKIIETVGLTDYAETRIANLSGGQRQRAAIGKALASKADLLLMDEPMVGVDLESRNSIMRLLDNLCHTQNKTIVMISHDLASMKRTVHRMVYLEQQIKYDGSTNDFPELSVLADLRGIEETHPEGLLSEGDQTAPKDIITVWQKDELRSGKS